jgi:hypothetical protein
LRYNSPVMKKAAVVLLAMLIPVSATRASAECLIETNHPVTVRLALRICAMYPDIRKVAIHGRAIDIYVSHHQHQSLVGERTPAERRNAESSVILMLWEIGQETEKTFRGYKDWPKFLMVYCERTSGSQEKLEYLVAGDFVFHFGCMHYTFQGGKQVENYPARCSSP